MIRNFFSFILFENLFTQTKLGVDILKPSLHPKALTRWWQVV